MKEENNIRKYTAADIERYHKGKLSLKERHDLEKAALDDPFLADALEGYAVAGANTEADIQELKTKLAERVEAQQAASSTGSRRPFFYLRVAAAIILLAGFGWLVYQFGFNKKQLEIAQAKPDTVINKETVVQDSTINQPTQPVSTTINNGLASDGNMDSDRKTTGYKSLHERSVKGKDNKTGEINPTSNFLSIIETKTDTIKSAPVVTVPEKNLTDKKDLASGATKISDQDIKREKSKEAAGRGEEQKFEKDGKELVQQNDDLKKKSVPTAARTDELNFNARMNTFRGKVTDATNTGVPFANVTNVQDNAGTYTDANGNFILTSSDSVLNVQVRSVGFENNNALLRNEAAGNRVVLQEDRKNLNEVVVSNTKPNTEARYRNSNITLNEPKPADGWEKYDSYLANNLNVPEDFKTQKTENNSVEVSFEVNKNGEPVNIKIERSLCSSCDKEAIRLIKQGPRWIRNARKNGRTTVTINF